MKSMTTIRMARPTMGVCVSGIFVAMTATPAFSQTAIVRSVTLDRDVAGGVIVMTDGITLDCANHHISGTATIPAVQVIGRARVTVANCFVNAPMSRGFFIRDTRDSVFEKNSVAGAVAEGFRVEGSEGSIFRRNAVLNNGRDGFDLGPGSIVCAGNLFVQNSAGGNAVNGIEMDSCTNNSFVANSVTSNGQHGFSLDDSHRNIFLRNTVQSNRDTGVHITRKNNENVLANNNMSENVVSEADQSTDSFCNMFQGNTFGRSTVLRTIPGPTPNSTCP